MSDEFNGIEDAAQEEEVEQEASATEEPEATEKPKKRGKGGKILLIVGIVVVVLVAAVVVLYATTHSNPRFCNALCHVPMDPYVDSYLNGVSLIEAQNDPAYKPTPILSVVTHRDAEVICLDCHEPSMGEQISEGIKWLTGDYEVPLLGFILTAKDPKKDNEVSGVDFCLKSGCHEATTLAELEKTSSSYTRPYHEMPHNVSTCSDCHKVHSQSRMVCGGCHADANIPDGWIRK